DVTNISSCSEGETVYDETVHDETARFKTARVKTVPAEIARIENGSLREWYAACGAYRSDRITQAPTAWV
ncbi:MAG: hypothetical protein ACRC22_12380, partial [Shewanella sp.]